VSHLFDSRYSFVQARSPFVLAALIVLGACSGPGGAAPTNTPEVLQATSAPATAAPTLSLRTPTAVPSATEPSPSATSGVTATLTPTPESALPKILSNLCCVGSPLEPGKYRLPAWLQLPLSIEVGEGWRAINEEAALLFSIVKGRNVLGDASQMMVFLLVPDDRPLEDLLRPIQRADELVPLTEPSPVEIAQLSGLQFEAQVKPNPGYAGDLAEDIPPGVQILPSVNRYFTPGFLWTTATIEARLGLIAVHIGDQPLIIYLEAPPEEYDAFALEAGAVLQTLELIDE